MPAPMGKARFIAFSPSSADSFGATGSGSVEVQCPDQFADWNELHASLLNLSSFSSQPLN
jgi:hypothetical protein